MSNDRVTENEMQSNSNAGSSESESNENQQVTNSNVEGSINESNENQQETNSNIEISTGEQGESQQRPDSDSVSSNSDESYDFPMPNQNYYQERECTESFCESYNEAKESRSYFVEDLQSHRDLQDQTIPYMDFEGVLQFDDNDEALASHEARIDEDQANAGSFSLEIGLAIADLEKERAEVQAFASKQNDEIIKDYSNCWNEQLQASAARRDESLEDLKEKVDTLIEAGVDLREAFDTAEEFGSFNQIHYSSRTAQVENEARPNTGSLVDDYADVSLEQPSYMDPED